MTHLAANCTVAAALAAVGRIGRTAGLTYARATREPAARRMQGGAAAVAVRALKDGDLLFAATDKEQGMWLEVQGAKVDAAYAHAAGYELCIDNPDDLSTATAALLGRVALPKELWSRVRQVDTLYLPPPLSAVCDVPCMRRCPIACSSRASACSPRRRGPVSHSCRRSWWNLVA